MTREQLEHAIRAACDIIGEKEVFVIGSQAILATHPDAPRELLRSMEADISPVSDFRRWDRLEAIGEGSSFHVQFGFYVDGLPIDEVHPLPRGWEARAIRLSNANTRHMTGRCIEAHDLAASKLAAHRSKDRDFVRVLLIEGLITPRKLISRIRLLPITAADRGRLVSWVDGTMRDLRRS